MSYTSVNKIVELKDESEREEYKELIPMFELMYELADILRTRRFKRGSIDFDFPESKIILDEKGKPVDIKEYERNNAHRIIEEVMLAANQTVAEEFYWQEIPFVYRVHEEPDSEKIVKLASFVGNFGYTIKNGSDGDIHPKEIQKLVDSVKGTPEEAVISRLALRSMKQAKYTTGCDGHFGLAMKYYCHFTSPIRRYPDLQIHRIIKENIHGRMPDRRIEHYNKILPEIAIRASELERRADESEREVEKIKKAEYMEQFIGESFDGVISGVSTWGIYVELPNTVEGMVRIADIPGDYYYFDEERYSMVGEYTGKTYKLGDPVKITVAAVDKLIKTIDFVFYDEAKADLYKVKAKAVESSEVILGKSEGDAEKVKPIRVSKASGERKNEAVGVTHKKKKVSNKSKVKSKKAKGIASKKDILELKEKAEKAFAKKLSAKKKSMLVEAEAKKLTSSAKSKKKNAVKKAKKSKRK